MSAGELRERVRFERRREKADGAGNTEGDWIGVATVSARIQPIRGGEEVQARRLAGTRVVLIRVRRSSQVAEVGPHCRAVDARTGESYNIRAVENRDERRLHLDITAESGVADG